MHAVDSLTEVMFMYMIYPFKCPMKYVYLCEMYIEKQLSHLTVPTEHSITLNPESILCEMLKRCED